MDTILGLTILYYLCELVHLPTSESKVVKGNMFPIIDNIMIVDWIADDLSTNYLIPSLGSAIRVNFLKLKEDVNKDEVLSAVKGILENFKKISVGRK